MSFFVDNAGWIALAVGVAGLVFAWLQRGWILRQDAGTEGMQRIAGAIQRGAEAFMRREYRYVAILVVSVSVVLLVMSLIPEVGMSIWTVPAFLSGAFASGIAGYAGMRIAVRANVRTAAAAQKSLDGGLRVAFSSGSVMGTMVVSLALFGLAALFAGLNAFIEDRNVAVSALAGFGFGGTAIAIFARVGGGIFTKAADVGADLVGKTEANIPEDDPRNPAVIADNVGDNVGDVAGMGSDLFESYASSIIAAITLAVLAGGGLPPELAGAGQAFPLLVAASGLVLSMAATFLVRTREGATQQGLLNSLRRGVYSASAMVAVAIVFWAWVLGLGVGVMLATLAGLFGGGLIGLSTEYFTSEGYRPTRQLAERAEGGSAIVIIEGMSVGMQSVIWPVLVVIVVTLISVYATGLYGVAVAAVGMLATLSITLASDAYGPVADNAGGIAEMAKLEHEVRERTDALDSLGNTTAATGKGFAIGSAVMTALALISAVVTITGTETVGILDAKLLTGLMLGAMLPYVFSSQTMQAVGRAAQLIVNEVRRQFREIPGLIEGEGEPDYESCVAISTESAIREMLGPSAIAVAVPIVIALVARVGQGTVVENFVGPETTVGVLVGSLISAFMLALMMANAGGSWDNAKKYIESGKLEGDNNGKGSEAHKAAVVGDTVGDPFKDTAGPSLNILLKLLAIVSLVIAPLLV